MRPLLLSSILLLAPLAAQAQDAPRSNEPHARVETNVGDFVIRLDPVRAPLTVENFLSYVVDGHYSGLIFHRVVGGFVAQTGGFTQDYVEKPTDDPIFNESGNGLSNMRGTVGLARSNDPHSGTSQFYINLADNLDLNPRPTRWGYAVFGTVVEGMDVVDEIGHRPTDAAGPFESSVPVDPVVIENIVLLGK